MGESETVGEWLAKRQPDWTRRGRDYWKPLFRAADAGSSLPNNAAAAWGRHVSSRQSSHRIPDGVMSAGHGLQKPSDWVAAERHLERMIASGAYPEIAAFDIDRYGAAASMLRGQIKAMVKGLDYVDNLRIARCDRRWEVKQYGWAKERGCCGFRDEIVTVLGRAYMIGCNYGH